MRGGKRKGAGRKPGSDTKSRTIQKFCRFNLDEFKAVSAAANFEKKAFSKFVSDSAVETANVVLGKTTSTEQ